MKKRNGFVSNSSSASFIVSFDSDISYNEILSMIEASTKWCGVNIRIDEENLKQIDQSFEFTADTSMFNDWYDILTWPFFRMLDEEADDRFKLIELRQTESEYMSCNNKVRFDSNTWEMDWIKHRIDRHEEIKLDEFDMEQKNQLALDAYFEQYLAYLKDSTKTLSAVKLLSERF